MDETTIDTSDDFESAYESYAQGIYRFLLWRTQDSDLSEDLTSSVFEKAWRSRSTFEGGSLQGWFYRIARNTLIDHWRKKQTVPLHDAGDLIDEKMRGLDESLDLESDLTRMRRAVKALPPEMEQIITLRFIEGLSCKAVAKRLGMSEGNVRVTQYRALKKLRDYLS